MKQNETLQQQIRLKAYSITELAELYGRSGKTMKMWLGHIEKEIGPRMGHFYTPKQVGIIFEEFGFPEQ